MQTKIASGLKYWSPTGVGAILYVCVVACSSDDGADTSAATGSDSTTAGEESTAMASTGSGGGTSGDVTTTTSTTGSDEGPDVRVGLFTVALRPEDEATMNPAHTNFQGQIRDNPQPDSMVWEVAETSGGCKLLIPTIPFCDPGCGATGVCTEDGVCTPHPTRVGVGAITVTGVELQDGSSEFSLEPTGANLDYLTGASVSLAYPPFSEGDQIELSAAGGDYAAFSIQISGIAQLEVGGPDPLPIDREQAMDLEWTAAEAGDSQIDILVDISHHGGVKGKIECTVADTGSYTIDGALVTQLIDLGFAGFPLVKLTRRSIGSARIAVGRVDFEAASYIERQLSIPGLTSCFGDEDCEDGQTCQPDRSCG